LKALEFNAQHAMVQISTINRNQTLWDAKKVDQENFKKHGITAAVG
jgi:hypothetical protein